jgi:hypothetical protein
MQAVGPAVGTVGTGLKGASKAGPAEVGRYLTSVEVAIVDKATPYQTSVYLGEVLVELALVEGKASLGAPAMSPSRWHDAVYVANAQGAILRPNAYIPVEGATLIARVWHRDDVTGGPWSVKITPTYSDRPSPGVESAVREAWAPYNRTGANPAANAEAVWTSLEGMLVWVNSFSVNMVLDANAASRYPGYLIRMTAAGVVIGANMTSAGQAASTTFDFSGAAGSPPSTDVNGGGIVNLALPVRLILSVGMTLATQVLNKQATDNWSAMTVHGAYRVVPTEAAS